MNDFTVLKRDHCGTVVFQYQGTVVDRGEGWVCIQARVSFERADVGAFIIQRNDLMTEWFYTDRYYNVFRVQDGITGQLKGWYCNITRPAEIDDHHAAADDLALDVVVTPTGEVVLLDEDEFAALELSEPEQIAAWHAVDTIRRLVAARRMPFNDMK